MSKELVFHVEQDEDMLAAVCHEPEMATQGENLEELIVMIRDLVRCRFDDGDERLGWQIRLHFLQDPKVLPAQVAELPRTILRARRTAATETARLSVRSPNWFSSTLR